MCNTHNKVFGKDTIIEMEYINRNLKKGCNARIAYLEKQASSFRTWLEEQGAEDVDKAIANIIFSHFDKEDHVSDIQVDATQADPTLSERLDIEEELQDELMASLEKNVNRSFNTKEAVQWWWMNKLLPMQQELELHNKIQDFMDTIPMVYKLKPSEQAKYRNPIKKCFMRLDALKKDKKLGYDAWLEFNNQLYVKLGRPTIKAKYVVQSLPDRISYYEKRMQEEVAKWEAKQMEFQERSLDALDNDLIQQAIG